MPDASATVDTEDIVAGLISFVDRFVLPLGEANRDLLVTPAKKYNEAGRYSDDLIQVIRQVRQASAAAGYYDMFAPASLGGGGLGYQTMARAYEALHERYGPAQLLPHETIAHWASGPSHLWAHVAPELRDEVYPALAAGTLGCCFAMSEPDAGSDIWMMSTRAVRDGQDWLITGTKQWISSSPYSDYAFVFAVTDPAAFAEHRDGVTCFLVPMTAPGAKLDSVIKLFGSSGGNEGILSFDEVRVPVQHVVGVEGRGMALALQSVNVGRIYNTSRCVGMAQWALDAAVRYAKTRVTFGAPLINHQGISFPLADTAMEIYAARLMMRDVATRLDEGEKVVTDLSIAKAYSTETCFRAYDRAMQTFGGMGLTNEVGLVDGWHESRLLRIADGSAEIMRRVILNDLARRSN